MEVKSYPILIGERVFKERKQRKMTQEDFYHFLFPDNDKSPETIKKKMNSIENGKQKDVDFLFLEALCEKCDISMDSILKKSNYSNHNMEFVCQYTGLEENTVKQLHKWSKSMKSGASINDEDPHSWWLKQEASEFLFIVNYLFKSGKRSKKDPYYKIFPEFSNLTILHSIYLMTVEHPVYISGMRYYEDDDTKYSFEEKERVCIDAKKYISMEDSSGALWPVETTEILKHLAQKRLEKDLESLSKQIKENNQINN